MTKNCLRGVTRSGRCAARPWRAQIAAAGKNYHLAFCETEEEAARAYDNALYYLRHFGFGHPGHLNFPGEYEATPAPMTETTRRVILDCTSRKGARDPEKLHRVFTRLLPVFRQMAAALAEVEDALAGCPPAQPEGQEIQEGQPQS